MPWRHSPCPRAVGKGEGQNSPLGVLLPGPCSLLLEAP